MLEGHNSKLKMIKRTMYGRCNDKERCKFVLVKFKKIMRSKYRVLFIAFIVYLIFFAVSYLYSPWSKLLDEAHTVYDTSNVKHNFIFVRSVFYGISDMLDMMLWGILVLRLSYWVQ